MRLFAVRQERSTSMARNLALEKCYVVNYRFAFIDKKDTRRFMDEVFKCS